MIASASKRIGIRGGGHTAKRFWYRRQCRRAKMKRFIIKKRETFGRGTGLAQIATIITHGMQKNPPTNAKRYIFRRFFIR